MNSVCLGPDQVLFPGPPLQIPTSYHLQPPLPTCVSWAEVFIPQLKHGDDNSGYYKTGALSGHTGRRQAPAPGHAPYLFPPALPSSLPLLFSLINSVDKPRYSNHAHNIITAFMELVLFVGLSPLPVLSFSPLKPSDAAPSIYSILQRRRPRLDELSGFP